MHFLAIARLAGLFALLSQDIVHSAQFQTAWEKGPPGQAQVESLELYWTATTDYMHMHIRHDSALSIGVSKYHERPLRDMEFICIAETDSMLFTYGFMINTFFSRMDFTLDIWPFGYQQRVTQVTVNEDEFRCYDDGEEGDNIIGWCTWHPPTEKRAIFG